jgi:hypothetical protein
MTDEAEVGYEQLAELFDRWAAREAISSNEAFDDGRISTSRLADARATCWHEAAGYLRRCIDFNSPQPGDFPEPVYVTETAEIPLVRCAYQVGANGFVCGLPADHDMPHDPADLHGNRVLRPNLAEIDLDAADQAVQRNIARVTGQPMPTYNVADNIETIRAVANFEDDNGETATERWERLSNKADCL